MARAEVKNNNSIREFEYKIYAASIADLSLVYDQAEMAEQSWEKPDHAFTLTLNTKEHGDYEHKIWFNVNIKMDSNGQLDSENATIGRLFEFLDAIDYKGGYNTKGEWEDCSGAVITEENIANDILAHILKQTPEPLLIAIYPQKQKNGKTVVKPGWSIYANTKEGMQEAKKRYDKLIARANSGDTSTPTRAATPKSNAPRI